MRRLIPRIPLVTSFIFATAYVSQVVRMWSERSALGQSVFGWVQVGVALVLFYIYYREMLPDQKLPRYCTVFEIVLVLGIIGTTIYFR